MMLVIGARGRLGAALVRELSANLGTDQVIAPDRAVYESWWRPEAVADIQTYLASISVQNGAPLTILVVSGVLDPKQPPEEHERVNVLLPLNIIKATAQSGAKVVTFGTIMERLMETPNAYVASKAQLSTQVEKRVAEGRDLLHARIHTLYGGEPSPFMFTGLMIKAIRQNEPFRMTQGRQLREYHHVDDDARAIVALLSAQSTGIVELNHGTAVSLRDLAEHVFAGCGVPTLLELGSLPEPPQENYQTRFIRPPVLNSISFRDTLPAVAQYVRLHATKG